jgi:hypothetical protein
MIEIESKSKWVKIIPIWIKYGSSYSKLHYADKIFFEKGILDSIEIIVFGKRKKLKIEDFKTYQIILNEKMLVIMFCSLLLGFLSTLLLVLEKNSFYGPILIFIFLIVLIQQLVISHISVNEIS